MHLHTHAPQRPEHHHSHDHHAAATHHHDHAHGHGITLVGLMHGLAGTSAVVALVPVTLMHRMSIGLGYLLAFGVGVTTAMTMFAAVSAMAMKQAAGRSMALGRRISSAVGYAGILTGAIWIWRALIP